MDNLFGESNAEFDWEALIDYSNNENDIFATSYEDPNLLPPLDLLLETAASKVDAEHVNTSEQASSVPEGNFNATNHHQTSSPDSRSLEDQVRALASKVQEVKQMYVTQNTGLWRD